MRRSFARTLTLVAAFVTFQSTHAHAQDAATILVAENAISNVVDGVRQAATDVIDNAGNVIDSNSFSTSQRIQLLLRELDTIASNNTDKIFSQLSETEQQVFRDALFVITKIEEGTGDAFDEANSLLERINGTIGSLPLMDRSPRVEIVGPSYFLFDAEKADETEIRLSVRGAFLDHGTPVLTFDQGECSVSQFIGNSTSFACSFSKDLFEEQNDYFSLTGALSYQQPRSRWERFVSLFSDNTTFKQYGVEANFIPKNLGSYSLTAIVATEDTESQPRRQEFRDGNSHCAGSRTRDFNFSVTPGWSIDTNSIRPTCRNSSKSACHGLRNVTVEGFQYSTRISNNGDCAPRIFGQRAFVDGRGSVWGHVDWTEQRTTTSDTEVTVAEGALFWGQDLAINLPSGTKQVLLTVDQLNDEVKLADANLLSDWFEVTVDIGSQVLVIRPKDIHEALR